jgi:DDE superfamily endonuclease
MIEHEPSIFSTTPIGGRSAGFAAIDPGSKHLGGLIQTMSPDLAVGRWVQHHRGGSDCQSALYKRSQMGQTLPIRWIDRAARSRATGSSQNPWRRNRGVGHQDSHLPPSGPRSGIHHVVAGQTGRTSSSTLRHFYAQSRNDPPRPVTPRPAVSDRADLVQKHRSRIRGKKNAIIQIYRHRPRWGQVVCFDEMGPLQTIPRGGHAWGRHAALRPDRYKRNGTLQWLCAFNPHSGRAIGQGFSTKSAESCRTFWLEQMLPAWPKGGIHLVMDNLSAHKKALRELPARIRRRIHVYWTPTNSSWLNLVESYFATLQRTALHNTDYRTPIEIEKGLQRGTYYLNENPRPYKWKKV